MSLNIELLCVKSFLKHKRPLKRRSTILSLPLYSTRTEICNIAISLSQTHKLYYYSLSPLHTHSLSFFFVSQACSFLLLFLSSSFLTHILSFSLPLVSQSLFLSSSFITQMLSFSLPLFVSVFLSSFLTLLVTHYLSVCLFTLYLAPSLSLFFLSRTGSYPVHMQGIWLQQPKQNHKSSWNVD